VDEVPSAINLRHAGVWLRLGATLLMTVLLPSLSLAMLGFACRQRSGRLAVAGLLLQLAGMVVFTAALLFLPGVQ
jgi:hypothetical protein